MQRAIQDASDDSSVTTDVVVLEEASTGRHLSVIGRETRPYGVGAYADAVEVSDEVRIGSTVFRALTLEALIASRKAVRRKKDLEHLIELEAILELRKRRHDVSSQHPIRGDGS